MCRQPGGESLLEALAPMARTRRVSLDTVRVDGRDHVLHGLVLTREERPGTADPLLVSKETDTAGDGDQKHDPKHRSPWSDAWISPALVMLLFLEDGCQVMALPQLNQLRVVPCHVLDTLSVDVRDGAHSRQTLNNSRCIELCARGMLVASRGRHALQTRDGVYNQYADASCLCWDAEAGDSCHEDGHASKPVSKCSCTQQRSVYLAWPDVVRLWSALGMNPA